MVPVGYQKTSTIIFLRKLTDAKLINVLCHIFVQKSISDPDISRQPSHKYQGKETTQLFIEIVSPDMRDVNDFKKLQDKENHCLIVN